MAHTTLQRCRLMRMSWDIQRNKKRTRAKALQAAWAIYANEDITIQYLALRLNGNKPVKARALNQMSIFQS